MSILELLLSFFKFGLLSIGGGYVLVPILQAELVEGRGLLSNTEFVNLLSIAQITPGPIGINTATYVGFLVAGIAGGIAASLALIAPSCLLVTAAAKYLNAWKNHPAVHWMLSGARPAAWGLVAAAVLIFLEMSVLDGALPRPVDFWNAKGSSMPGIRWSTLPLLAAAFLMIRYAKKVPLVLLIVLSAIYGAFFCR